MIHTRWKRWQQVKIRTTTSHYGMAESVDLTASTWQICFRLTNWPQRHFKSVPLKGDCLSWWRRKDFKKTWVRTNCSKVDEILAWKNLKLIRFIFLLKRTKLYRFQNNVRYVQIWKYGLALRTRVLYKHQKSAVDKFVPENTFGLQRTRVRSASPYF